jgi:hypothetical protein
MTGRISGLNHPINESTRAARAFEVFASERRRKGPQDQILVVIETNPRPETAI